RFSFDVLYLLAVQVALPAADRAVEGLRERVREGGGVEAEIGGHRCSGRFGALDQLLVAELEGSPGDRPRGGDVAAPGPRGPTAFAGGAEVVRPLGFDPDPGVGAVGEPGVVASRLVGAEPPALEERADDVAAVADDVDGVCLRICVKRRREDEARLR